MEIHKQKIHHLTSKISSKQQHYLSNKTLQIRRLISPNKCSITNILNNTSKLKYKNNNIKYKNKKYFFNTTSINTPYQKSQILLSYLSTPKQKSFENKIYKNNNNYNNNNNNNNHINNNNNNIKKIYKLNTKNHQQLRSTQQQNYSNRTFKVNFYISGKFIYSKNYQNFISFKTIKQQFCNDWSRMVPQKLRNNSYGIIGMSISPYNHHYYNIINNKNEIKIQYLENIGLNEIKLIPNLISKQIDYTNLNFKDFEILKYLGSGGFSQVYLAKCLIDYQYCALKFIHKNTINSIKKINMLENQKNILFSINHINLIDLYYAFETQNYIIFGLEYCSNGNLYTYLNQIKKIQQQNVKLIFIQILKGIQYLHQNKILFRDVKLENILFNYQNVIKITDFGLSKPNINNQDINYSYCGSPEYMAPQMLSKCGHSFSVDYYALGILLYELLVGRSPFYAQKKEEIFFAVLNSQPKFPKSILISKQAKQLIRGLLIKNPQHRIGSLSGIKQILSHPWLRGIQSNKPINLIIPQYNNLMLEEEQEIEKKKLKKQFSIERNNNFQNYFFSQSYVNKSLIKKVQKLTMKFKQKQKIKLNTVMSEKNKNKNKNQYHLQ